MSTDQKPPSPEQSTISVLLKQARSGDAAARDSLFEKCRNYLALMARLRVARWLQPRVDASDLVQQTLLDAYRGFHRFEGVTEAEWLGWLKQILTHNSQDFIRRSRAQKRDVAQEERWQEDSSNLQWSEPADPGESPSRLVLQHERELELADAITKLSEDHQEVILLRNFEQLTFPEIAERMNRTGPAIQMLWMRAIKRLEELLRERDA